MNWFETSDYELLMEKLKKNESELRTNGNVFDLYTKSGIKRCTFKTIDEIYSYLCGYEAGYEGGRKWGTKDMTLEQVVNDPVPKDLENVPDFDIILSAH